MTNQAFDDGYDAWAAQVSRFANPGGHHRVTFMGADYASDWDRGWCAALRHGSAGQYAYAGKEGWHE
jgi:hypothetical protein